eukprot:jgi/Mesen1/3870/ME000207S02871
MSVAVVAGKCLAPLLALELKQFRANFLRRYRPLNASACVSLRRVTRNIPANVRTYSTSRGNGLAAVNDEARLKMTGTFPRHELGSHEFPPAAAVGLRGFLATGHVAQASVKEAETGRKGQQAGAPLPDELHATLPPDVVGDRRIIIVGDIHGCCDEFEELLERCGRTSDDIVVLVGDLVNKGPKSAQVVQLARELGVYAVRGNHDDSALAAYASLPDVKASGGQLQQKTAWVEDMRPDDASWLGRLPFTLRIPSHRALVVHAGLVPGRSLAQQPPQDLLTMRFICPSPSADEALPPGGHLEAPEGGRGNVLRDGPRKQRRLDRNGNGSGNGAGFDAGAAAAGARAGAGSAAASSWKSCGPSEGGSRLWGQEWSDGEVHVVFGHDAARGLQLHPCATGLDTGCVYGGQLTALVLPPASQLRESQSGSTPEQPLGGRLISVPARRVYDDPQKQK